MHTVLLAYGGVVFCSTAAGAQGWLKYFSLAAVTGEDLDRAERILKRLEWDRRASRALHLAQ